MEYFTQLPLVEYQNLTNNGQSTVALTNILTRSSFLREIVENTALFYEYSVKDGETPEIIADKLYGDVRRFWIVLLFNQLSNPYYDFPLIQDQLDELIVSKYGMTLEEAQTTIHHYEQRTTRTIALNGIVQDSNIVTVIVSAMEQDPTTSLAVQRFALPDVDASLDAGSTTESFGQGITVTTSNVLYAISNYTYEQTENEKRRNIRLLDKNYVTVVEGEFRRLMRDGN
jgi:hypothetical protein